MEELRRYWELPAVAHFCSLFRSVFKLQDFDIEELEEALLVDSDSAEFGGRSTLIVDLLVVLLKGNTGRKDVSLLNYNCFLHDLLSYRWEQEGLGRNPLGSDRATACFHSLSMYAKLKLLHYLCEWRLDRPDVEPVTKNLDGDSLRVNHLGRDDDGNVYWYFYGTRLYREKPKPVKIRIKTPNKTEKKNKSNKKKGKKSQKKKSKGKKKHSKKSGKVFPVRRSSRQALKKIAAGDFSEEEQKEEEFDSEENRNDSCYDSDREDQIDSKQIKDESCEDDEMHLATVSTSTPLKDNPPSILTKIKSELTNASGRSSPNSSEAGDAFNFREIIAGIYSRDEDEDSRMSVPPIPQEEGNSRTSGETTQDLDKTVEIEETVSTEQGWKESENLESADEQREVSRQEESGILAGAAKAEGKDEDQEVFTRASNVEKQEPGNELKKEDTLLLGPPPWEQPLLTADPEETKLWDLVCNSLEDWHSLCDKLKQSDSKAVKELRQLLEEEFIPEMEKLYVEKEKERQRKIAELLPRRSSDRIELKKLQRDEEMKKLAEREKLELEKLSKREQEVQKKYEQDKREQRLRMRELEKERIQKLKERAREERARRLDLRKKRQELTAAGIEIPPELMNTTELTPEDDSDLNELDIEIELEHMYGQLEKVLDMIKGYPEAEPFLHAVDTTDAPDYYEKIPTPMDFEAIENKLLEREYKNKFEFIDDVNLVFLNCFIYNGWRSEYTRLAQKCERVFIRAFKKHFPSGEIAEGEEEEVIERLGALDKKIRDSLGERSERTGQRRHTPANREEREGVEKKRRRIFDSVNRSPACLPQRKPFQGYIRESYKSPRTVQHNTNPLAMHDYGNLIKKVPPNRRPVSSSLAKPGVSGPSQEDPAHPKWKIRVTSTPLAGKYNTPPRLKVPQTMSSSAGGYHSQQSPSVAYRTFHGGPSVVHHQPRILQNQRSVSLQNPQPGPGASNMPNKDKPNVYLIPMSDGNRLVKFVDKTGSPVSSDYVNQILPQIRREAHKLPKGLVTMTLNFDSAAEPPKKIRIPDTSASTSTHSGTYGGSNRTEQWVPTHNRVIPPPIAVSRVDEPHVSIPVSQFGSPKPGIGGASVSTASGGSPPKQTKVYSIGSNNFLSIEDGVPFLMRKAGDGSLVKVSEVSRDELVQKLNSIRDQKQNVNRPVCSVAPQPQVVSSAPPSSTVYLQSSSQNQPPVAVVFNQNPQQKSEAVIVGGVGNQLPVVLSSSPSSVLHLGNTQTVVIANNSAQPQTNQQHQYQVIQVVPQIVLNTPAPNQNND